MAEWFEMEEREVLADLKTGREGLSEEEAARRLARDGENVIAEEGRLQWWQVFLAQFKDLLVVILIAAAAVSMLTGDAESAMVIFAVLLLNAVLGTVQHQRAQKSLAGLKRLASPQARVVRGGRACQIPASQVAEGDLLLLEAGDLAAADGRLLEVYGLKVNESSLTGESLGVEKEAEPLAGGVRPLAERTNMVFSGSLVTAGRAVAAVTATGMRTEIGRIARLMNDTGERRTPLQVSLDRFSGHLAAAVIAVCGLIFAVSLCRHERPLDALMFAVALAVAAIPEALSSIVTIVQAMGTQKMAREQAIIKDLKAVESLGCVSVICSDKTGTLTQNRMSVEKVWAGGRALAPEQLAPLAQRSDVRLFLWTAVLNNNAAVAGGGEGDPLEAALLHMAEEAGVIPEQVRLACPRRGEIPFDSGRKLMTTVNEAAGERLILVKGAPDVLLARCSRAANPGGGGRELTASEKSRVEAQNERWSRQGLRILALAYRPLEEAGAVGPLSLLSADTIERELIFLGLAAMMDPPRPESRAAVASARQAGIRPVMITGDHLVTAMAIASRIGILEEGDLALTGQQLDALDESALERQLPQIAVYARVSPQHKLRIVGAWQRRGQIVAMTGDGVNDAPALRKADIGVAMGRSGTEVSKEAASMILADDNFATIIKAVANGRSVYCNIRNAIQFLLSGNMAGILCVLYTSLRALPLPFAPVQLLFINLLTDSLPALAIGMEPPEEGMLRRPPRNPREGILTLPFTGTLLFQGSLIAAAALWAYTIGLSDSAATAGTMAFATLTLARLFHGFNCRSSRSILSLGLMSNPYSLLAFALGAVLLAAVLLAAPLRPLLAAVPLSGAQAAAIPAAALLPTLVIQIQKILREAA